MSLSSDEIGPSIIKALNLPTSTRKVEVIFESGKAVKIKGEFYTEHKYIEKFCGVLEDKKVELKLEG